MPAIETSNAAPSTLIDVLGQVKDAFDAAGDATPIMIGPQYIDQWGTGHGARVLFVPEPPGAGGKIQGARALGNRAAQVHSCNVFVRADEETDDDLTRWNLTYALSDRVIDLIGTAGEGCIEWGACSDDSPLRVSSGVGAGVAYSFTYKRDIRHDAARWRARPLNRAGAALTSPMTTGVDTSPPVLLTSPAAVQGSVGTISITTEAE